MKAQKGSITVMLILVLCAILMTVTLVVETARIKIAENQAKRAVDTALFSALASFDQDAKDEYGLFYRYGTKGLDAEMQEAVEKSLLITDGSSAWHPYEFQIKSLQVRTLFPLTDRDSIRHQILEYMKYRGPVELVGDVVEKLGAFFSMQSTARVMKEDMAVDQKIKRLADEINALQALMPTVTGYSDTKLRSFNGYAKTIAEKAMQLETLEREADALDPLEDAGEIADIRNRMDALHQNMTEAGEALLDEITPVRDANRSALEICRELKQLGPEIERAIASAEAALDQEKHVNPEVAADLTKKYEAYRKYCNTAFLEDMAEALQNNAALLEPKCELLEQLLGGGISGYNPPVFSQTGYQSVSFDPPQYPGSPPRPENGQVNLTPAVIAKLLNTVRGYIQEIKNSVWVDDHGPIMNCPGNRFSAAQGDIPEVAGDDYDSANDALTSIYDSVGKPVDSDSLIDALAQGTLEVSDDIYDALLVNEYVLMTFNSREDGGRGAHTLQETEVEYVLVGNSNPQTNASLSQLEMIAWRTVFNAVSFSFYCPEISKNIDGASAGLNALTGIPYPVWKGVITGLLSFLESYADTKRMVEGESIHMFKFRLSDTSLATEFRDLLSESGFNDVEKKAGTETNPPNPAKSSPQKDLMVDYEDHLRAMLLYRSLLGQSDTTLCRIQDLIYTNIRQVRGEYDPAKHFNFIEADAQFTIKSFFPNLSGIRIQADGIPLRHTIHVECGRGY